METSPGPWRPVPADCKILCNNVRGLARNLSDLTVASSPYDILLCSETLVTALNHVSDLLVPVFGRTALLCWGRIHRAQGMVAHVGDGYRAFRQPKFECG